MSTVIRNGTVVTADLSYSADILVDNGVITDIGDNLSGGTELDASDCYIIPQTASVIWVAMFRSDHPVFAWLCSSNIQDAI